jgi:phospholipid/cholesterol/gamma-HCH transport system ATP-binding protein
VTAPSAEGAHVELRGVELAFGSRRVFNGLSCGFPSGQISVIMGSSGCGKSTILRLIGGLIQPDAGEVCVGPDAVHALGEIGLAQMRRRLGMLFQNGALLDSMSIFENVALPLREHARMSAQEIEHEVHRGLSAVGLEDVDDLLPGELSGGMLRRAAFARAIVMEPEILLCDEPFSGLDPPNVTRIENLLVDLNKRLGLTILVTSHHMASSLRMGDRIVLLREGGAVAGKPAELAGSEDSEIRSFIGEDGQAFLAQRRQAGSQREHA